MGEVNIFSIRKDHQEEDNPGDRGTNPVPKGSNKPSHGYCHDSRHIIFQNNTILPEP